MWRISSSCSVAQFLAASSFLQKVSDMPTSAPFSVLSILFETLCGLLSEVSTIPSLVADGYFLHKWLHSFAASGQICSKTGWDRRPQISTAVPRAAGPSQLLQPSLQTGTPGCCSSPCPLPREALGWGRIKYLPTNILQQLFAESTKLSCSEAAFPLQMFIGLNFKISLGAYISGSHYVCVALSTQASVTI